MSRILERPRAVITNRLEALFESGTVTVIAGWNPEFLGIRQFAHVSVETSVSDDGLRQRLAGLDSTVFASVTSGNHDMVLDLRVADQNELYSVLATIREFPGVVALNTQLYIEVIGEALLPRGAMVKPERVDDIDRTIVQLLQVDGRASYQSLSDVVHISPGAVKKRLNLLLERNLVSIGAVVSNRSLIGRAAAGIGLNVSGDGASTIAALSEQPGIEFLARVIGRFDVLLTVTAETVDALSARLDTIRGLVGVNKMESWVHLRTLKERYPVSFGGPRPFSQG
nr:Lrp/AsnC ligand binding domain-containing protein [Lysinibacter cavernae]